MITNNKNISLNMAIFLATDNYDYNKESNYISVTSLLKPLRAIITGLNSKASAEPDVLDFVASRVGTAIHTASENAWLNGNYKKSMWKLGCTSQVINAIKVNPTKEEVETTEGIMPVYLERRSIKEIEGFKVGGKFDCVMDGNIRDIKTVKAFSYMKNDMEPYRLQLSIYRWLNQDIIPSNIGYVDMLITDWKQYEADAKPEYPQTPVVEKRIKLMSLTETEEWLKKRLNSITQLINVPQDQLPLCTPEELWASPDKWAFYAKPESKRATKVSEDQSVINQMYIEKGSKGRVEYRAGTPKRCDYCLKAECSQAQDFILQGLISE